MYCLRKQGIAEMRYPLGSLFVPDISELNIFNL